MVLTQRLSKYRVIQILFFLFIIGLTSAVSAQQRMAVSVDVANIRSGPGTDYEQLWQVERYTPIRILDSQEGWYFFEDFEGTKGWIHKDLVSDINTVITKKGLINVRKGPGTDHQVAFQAEKGVPFKVLEKKGDWVHIQHSDGEKGWIYAGLVW